ncbi:MAG: secondary thiamine-phosphate synthase enzyme YjbQ, partial [Ignavibacteria bacterium]
INENADSDVRKDFETHFNVMVPENANYFRHTSEGPDDMTSHIKSSLLGCSLNIPVTGGKLNLGTWQGIYLCEHRNSGGKRNIVITLFGIIQ